MNSECNPSQPQKHPLHHHTIDEIISKISALLEGGKEFENHYHTLKNLTVSIQDFLTRYQQDHAQYFGGSEYYDRLEVSREWKEACLRDLCNTHQELATLISQWTLYSGDASDQNMFWRCFDADLSRCLALTSRLPTQDKYHNFLMVNYDFDHKQLQTPDIQHFTYMSDSTSLTDLEKIFSYVHGEGVSSFEYSQIHFGMMEEEVIDFFSTVLPNIRSIAFRECMFYNAPPQILKSLFGKLGHTQHLKISRCNLHFVDDVFFQELWNHLCVDSLFVHDTLLSKYGSAKLKAISNSSSPLRALDLSVVQLESLNGEEIDALFSGLFHLHYLGLINEQISTIPSSKLKAIFSPLTSLRSLDLSITGFDKLSHSQMETIFSSLPSLESIVLKGVDFARIKREIRIELCHWLSKLKKVNLGANSNWIFLSSEELREVFSILKDIDSLTLILDPLEREKIQQAGGGMVLDKIV